MAVSLSSSFSGLDRDRTRNRDILAASRIQLLIAMKHIYFLLVSSFECNTLRGLWTDFSANPISSNRMQFSTLPLTSGFFSFFFLKFSFEFIAF